MLPVVFEEFEVVCIFLAIFFSLARILPYNDKIVDSSLILILSVFHRDYFFVIIVIIISSISNLLNCKFDVLFYIGTFFVRHIAIRIC